MEKIPMTPQGMEKLEIELKQLKQFERPEIIKAISEARAHGDLSENAEYHAARERQSFIEGRIIELEDMISRSEVIDPQKLAGEIVRFGATVTLFDEDSEKESQWQIVGSHEADIEIRKISFTAPLAKSLIGRSAGDVVETVTPQGTKSYEILKVEYV